MDELFRTSLNIKKLFALLALFAARFLMVGEAHPA
jgi:hypothetical protein